MGLLDRLFGISESTDSNQEATPSQETIVDTTTSLEVKVKERQPEPPVDGDQPLIGK
jgi:hypothetical protein